MRLILIRVVLFCVNKISFLLADHFAFSLQLSTQRDLQKLLSKCKFCHSEDLVIILGKGQVFEIHMVIFI